MSDSKSFMHAVKELEELEKALCNLPMVFAEMFKDEINALEEENMYDGIKGVMKKYSEDSKAISVINEFTSVITGGASLEEIIEIAIDEAVSPTIASEISVDNSCKME